MGNSLARNTNARSQRQGRIKGATEKYMSTYDKSRTGTLSREEVRALASDLLTQYTPLVGGLTEEDVDMIMSVGGRNVHPEITAEELPTALAIIAEVRSHNRYFHELFETHDTDKNGVLRVDQLEALLTEINEGQPIMATDVAYVLTQCEPRGKADPISEPQLKAAVACWYTQEPNIQDKIKSMFRAWDTAKTGHISKDEIVRVFTRLDDSLTGEQIELIFTSVDVNNNGKIEYDEFVDWVMEGGVNMGLGLDKPKEEEGAGKVSFSTGWLRPT